VAQCIVTYSPRVAYEAGQFFVRRRYLTKFGLLTIGSLLILVATLFAAYRFTGTDWFFGFVGTVLGLNAIMLSTSHFAMPRALRKAAEKLEFTQSEIVTDSEGFSVALAGSTMRLKWSRVRYLWTTQRFVILGFSFFRMLYVPTEGMTSEVQAAFSNHVSRLIGA
jgi:hypothetical protein